MGLDIFVGQLAECSEEEDEEDFAETRKTYDLLNEVLREAGHAPHHEPLTIPADQRFEARMWGYGGLHTVRRLAAYHALGRGLPPPETDYGSAADDPVLEEYYAVHDRHHRASKGWFARLRGGPKPKFQHLLWHSDAEGFYLPRDFEDVILDKAEPQRDGIGYMVGSSVRLLEECRELAELISLPGDIDPEGDEMCDAAESPPEDGPLWQRYGVESFCLARLIRGCEASLRTEGALVFG